MSEALTVCFEFTMMEKESYKSGILIGYTLAFVSMITDVLSTCCTQALQGATPDFQLSVVRSMVQAVAFIFGGKLVGSDFNIKKETIPGLVYLTLAYLLFNVGNYGATAYLPLVELRGMLDIARIATAFIHSRLFFYVEITKTKIISLFVCVVGIILTAQPSWLFSQMTTISSTTPFVFVNGSFAMHGMNTSDQYVNDSSKSHILLGYTLSIIGGTAMGLMYDINGIILRGVKPIVKATYAATFSAIGSAVFMFYMEDTVLMMDCTQFMFLLGHGVLSTATIFLFVQAAQFIPGPSLSMAYSFQIVIMLIAQYSIMHSIMPGNYNWIEVLGCMIIILGGSFSLIVDILEYKAKANEVP